MVSRVLFPALMEAGAGKQNAVLVIVVRRYADCPYSSILFVFPPWVVNPVKEI
jgi:hypothetical protein